jgi:hypothetical protein
MIIIKMIKTTNALITPAFRTDEPSPPCPPLGPPPIVVVEDVDPVAEGVSLLLLVEAVDAVEDVEAVETVEEVEAVEAVEDVEAVEAVEEVEAVEVVEVLVVVISVSISLQTQISSSEIAGVFECLMIPVSL